MKSTSNSSLHVQKHVSEVIFEVIIIWICQEVWDWFLVTLMIKLLEKSFKECELVLLQKRNQCCNIIIIKRKSKNIHETLINYGLKQPKKSVINLRRMNMDTLSNF